MSALNVAVVQLTSTEDIANNVDRILEIANEFPDEVDLICLPENALFFRISKTQKMPSIALSDPQLLRLKEFVDSRNMAMMVGSIPFRDDAKVNRPFNATVFLRPGKNPEVVYRKIHLFDVDVPGAPAVCESETFHHGPESAIIEWKGWKIGLSICYDIRFAELYNQYGLQNVDLILIPSAFLVPTGKAHWDILVRSRAIENQCFVVAAAQGGEHVSASGEKRHTYGHSMVVGRWGERIVELNDEQDWGVTKIDKSEIAQTRARIPMKQHRLKRNWVCRPPGTKEGEV